MRTRPCGDEALLVELSGTDQVIALHRSLRADPPVGFVDSVPGAQTLLMLFEYAVTDAERLAREVAHRRIEAAPAADSGPLVELPVRYDGDDLADVATRTGMSIAEVVARHTHPVYTLAFCGFAPGFGYLTGLDPALWLPRRDSPRVRVPAGAVAIADRFTGVYPRPSPGGWHLLGRTDVPLWTLDRDPPALLGPGCRVRFTPQPGDTPY